MTRQAGGRRERRSVGGVRQMRFSAAENRYPPMNILSADEIESIQQLHHALIGVEARRREAGRLPEMPNIQRVRSLHVGLEHLIRQLVESATPNHVIHAAVQAELVPFRL